MSFLTTAQKIHVAKIIKTKRNKFYGYTGGNRDLAKLLGISPQLLSMWACNKRSPGYQDLLKLSEVFDISLVDLCSLNKQLSQRSKKMALVGMNQEEARISMLKVCDITTDLVNRQRQMLHGELDAKEHKKVLARIKKYVDIL